MARRDVSSPAARDQAPRPVVLRRGDPGFGRPRGDPGVGRSRRGPGSGRFLLRLVAALAIGALAYAGAYQFRHNIVEAVPGSYGVLRALGFEDVAEPAGYGLRMEVAPPIQRIEGDGGRWIVLSTRIANTTDRPIVVPDLAVTAILRNGRNLAWSHPMRGLALAPRQTHTVQLRYLVGNVSGPSFPGVQNALVKFVRR